MKLLETNVLILLVCCCTSWVSFADKEMNVPLTFSLDESSLTKGNGNINQRSLSSWTWSLNEVENRIPREIWEAKCQTEFCVYPGMSEENSNLNSVPIYKDILVLTRRNGSHYTAAYRSVAVGCTCVRAQHI